MHWLRFFGLVFGAMFPALYALETTAAPYDVLGVKLGMTESEVRTILSENDGWSHQIKQVTFSYWDGSRAHSTPPLVEYIDSINAGLTSDGSDSFVAWLSLTHGDQRVIAIERRFMPRNAPSYELTERSLVEKYGQMSSRYEKGSLSGLFVWSEAGRPECWKAVLNESNPIPFDPARYFTYFQTLHARQEGKLPPSLTECGYALSVQVGRPVANNILVNLVDFSAWQKSLDAANRWVAELQAKAVEERAAQQKAPRL